MTQRVTRDTQPLTLPAREVGAAVIGAPLPNPVQIRVAIAVADEALTRVGEVAYACHALGFRTDSILTWVGVFTGSIEADCLAALRAIPGVAAVELERPPRIHRPPRTP
jgi:hypothetical protein